MNYVDANVLIYALTDDTVKGEKSRALLKEQRLATSILSLDEVSYRIKKRSLAEALKAVETLSKAPSLVFMPFLIEDVDAFREFLERGLKPRDAIHALSAAKSGASVIYSEDKDFDKLPITRKTPW